MKKVAIVTMYGTHNYGNRLQNFAANKTLKKMGYRSESLVSINQHRKKSFKGHIADLLTYLFPGVFSKWNIDWVRRINFIKFIKTNIPTRYIFDDDGFFDDNLTNDYDYFVVGSDQVWNPHFWQSESDYNNMFLKFVSKEKRVCFSPSIGVDEVPNEWIDRFKEGFEGFNYLSIRELSGAEIIKNLTGRDAELLIDPTMMLDADEWIKISKKAKAVKKPYVLEYFLGNRDEEKLKEIADSKKLSRLTLCDKANPAVYSYGPAEFIYMIANAELVCTDSFHACVFAILFNKPFIVLKRMGDKINMYSRIDTLLSLFGVDKTDDVIHIDESVRDNVLKVERKKVYEFLKKSFE